MTGANLMPAREGLSAALLAIGDLSKLLLAQSLQAKDHDGEPSSTIQLSAEANPTNGCRRDIKGCFPSRDENSP